MKQARPTCQIPAHPSSRFTPAVSFRTSRCEHLRSGITNSFILPQMSTLATNRRCLHPAQHCSKSSKTIRRTLRCIPSYSKLINRDLSPCSKGSNSPLQEDTPPVPRVLTLLYKRILTHSPPQEDNLNSDEFTNRTWKYCWGLYIL